MSANDPVVIGRISGAHGVTGAVRIVSLTHPPENLEHYRPWLLGEGERFREVAVCWVRRHGASFVAAVAGVSGRDQAQALAGQLIAVPRSTLPPLPERREYYWRDLIGMSVVDTGGRSLGSVRELLPTGGHDVLVIEGGEREVLIPFVEAFVADVDLAARRILVDWQDPA